MPSLLFRSSRRPGPVLAAGVLLLTPLILLSGLVAVVAFAAMTLRRHVAAERPLRPLRPTARPASLLLEPAPADAGLRLAGQHAA